MKDFLNAVLTLKYDPAFMWHRDYGRTKKGHYKLNAYIPIDKWNSKEEYLEWLHKWRVVYHETMKNIREGTTPQERKRYRQLNDVCCIPEIYIRGKYYNSAEYRKSINDFGMTVEDFITERDALAVRCNIRYTSKRHSYYLWVARNWAKQMYKQMVKERANKVSFMLDLNDSSVG